MFTNTQTQIEDKMADIRLILTDLGVDLDVEQGREFPLQLNYTAGSLRDINNRTTNFSLDFRIPANKKNKSALNHLNDANILDGANILKKTPVVVYADGIPIFTGEFKVLGKVNDRGNEEFNCILLGDGMDWVEGMKAKTPQSYDWGTIATLDKSTIEGTWTNDHTDGYTFPLVHYGAWSGDGGTSVLAQDLRPSLFMRSFFEKAFNAEGYTIQTDTDNNDFFNSTTNPFADNVVFPFTGTNWKVDQTDIDDYDLVMTRDGVKSYSVNSILTKLYKVRKIVFPKIGSSTQKASLGGDPSVDWNENGRVFRFYLENDVTTEFDNFDENSYAILRFKAEDKFTTEKGKVFEIINYGRATDSSVVTYVDLYTNVTPNEVSSFNNFNKLDGSTLRIISTNIGGGQKIDFDTETPSTTLFDTSTNIFTADNSITANFSFSCLLAGLDNKSRNRGIYTFKFIKKDGVTSTETVLNQEFINLTEDFNNDPVSTITVSVQTLFYTKNIKLNQIPFSFDTGDIDLKSGDQIWVEIECEPEEVSEGFSKLYELSSEGDKFTTTAYIQSAELKVLPIESIKNGYSLGDIANVLDDRYKTIDYIKGCIHAFNLLIKTDPHSKKVIIKTRDDFYDTQSNAVDWTEKIDAKKQYLIEYLDDYNKDLVFRFKDDDKDGYLKERNEIHKNVAGEYTHTLSDRFEEGESKMENPLFSYTYHIVDKNIVNKRTSPDGSNSKGIWLSRMWTEYASSTEAPPPAYEFRPRLLYYSYGTQYSNSPKWVFEGEDKTSVPSALPNSLSSVLDSYDYDFTVNLGYSNWNENGLFKTYYEKTVNTIEKSTRLELPVKLSFKDINNLDITKLIYIDYPSDIKGYYILDRVKNFLPSANVTTTIELIKKEDHGAIEIDTTQDEKTIDFNDREFEVVRDWYDKDVKVWNTGKGITSKDEIDTFTSDKELFVKNTKNVTGIKDISGALVDARNVKANKQSNTTSAVLTNEGNYARPNSGNMVSGRGNIASGRNQTVMGEFSVPSTKNVMAVGAGTSKSNRYNALSVGRDGIVREGNGHVVEEVSGNIQNVYEEVNGEMVKIVI